MAALAAGIVIGWKGSAAVLANPFQLQWTIVEFATAVAFICLVGLSLTSRTLYLVTVILSGVVATYSSANGMILWPLLVAAGVLVKISRVKLVVLAAAGAVSIGIFFIGYQFGESHFSNFLLHPFYTLEFIGSYLSMPFGAMKAPGFGAGLGLVNLVLAVVLAVIAARKRLFASPQGIVLFGWYRFTLGTAAIIAGARMHLGDGSFADAKTSRYSIVPLVNWGRVGMPVGVGFGTVPLAIGPTRSDRGGLFAAGRNRLCEVAMVV